MRRGRYPRSYGRRRPRRRRCRPRARYLALLSTLLAATPHAAENLIDQTGPRILEDPERIAARIFEDVTGSRRNLDGSTLRLPTAGPQVLRRRLQILHFEQRQARGSGTVVREEVLRPFRESESGDVRPELVVIPKDGRTEDLGVVFQIAFEIRGSDVEVFEPTERRNHGRRNAFVGNIVLGGATNYEIQRQGMRARGPTDDTTESRDDRGWERGNGLEQGTHPGRIRGPVGRQGSGEGPGDRPMGRHHRPRGAFQRTGQCPKGNGRRLRGKTARGRDERL